MTGLTKTSSLDNILTKKREKERNEKGIGLCTGHYKSISCNLIGALEGKMIKKDAKATLFQN